MTEYRGIGVQLDASNNGLLPKGHRLAQGGTLARSSTGTVEVGVLVDGMTPVVSGTGAMSYSVRACVVVAKHSDANGPTISANDGAVTIATTAAPGSNSRIDTVYAVQNLLTADGGSGTSNEFVIGVAQGSTSATPSPPSLAGIPGAVPLAHITVTSGATSTSGLTFTRAHRWVTANGGIVPDPVNPDYGWVWNGSARVLVPIGSQTQNVAFTSPFIPDSVQGATLTRMGRHVYLQGAMRSSGGVFGSASSAFVIPPGFRPEKTHPWLPVPSPIGSAVQITIAASTGVAEIAVGSGVALNYVFLATRWITADPTPPSI